MMAGICINRIMGEILSRTIGVFLLGRQSSKDIRLRRRGVVRRVVHLLSVFAFLPFFFVFGWFFSSVFGWERMFVLDGRVRRGVEGIKRSRMERERVGVCGGRRKFLI